MNLATISWVNLFKDNYKESVGYGLEEAPIYEELVVVPRNKLDDWNKLGAFA